MLALRSPALALALLGLGACFTDDGAPALSTEPGNADTGVDPATTDSGSSTTSGPSATSTGEAPTTAGATSTEATSTGATSTGCVLETWYFDIDKDGYGGSMSTEKCGAPGPGYTVDSLDCDDSKPAINPAAIEVCDTLDNDCDGGIDEYPAGSMETCNGCSAVIGPTSTYYFCTTPTLDWDGARNRCKTLLADLVIINDKEEDLFVKGQIDGFNLRWWIGLGDSANESKFVWVDNSPLDPGVPSWGANQPDNTDADVVGPANCVAITEVFFASWHDESCIDVHPIICEAPLPF